jgi:alpha/beta superfamily hydrolase
LVEGAAQSRKLKDSLEWSQEIDIGVLKETVSEYALLSAVAVMGGSSDATASLENSSANASFAITFHANGSADLFFSCKNTELKQTILEFLDTQQDKLDKVKIKVTVVD